MWSRTLRSYFSLSFPETINSLGNYIRISPNITLMSLLSGTESYLGQRNGIDVSAVLQDLFSFVILYNYIIPISLYVTIGECQLTLFELEVHKSYNYTRKAYFSIGILLLWKVCNTAMLVLSINRFI
jgi:hypothetical protein